MYSFKSLSRYEGKNGIAFLNADYIDNLKIRANNITLLARESPQQKRIGSALSPTISGDDYQLLYETPEGEQTIVLYEQFNHSWKIKIPDLKLGESTTVTAKLDARYFEGTVKNNL